MSSAKIWFGLACVTAGAIGVTACFDREPDAAETNPQQVTEGRESVLAAAVTLEGGCTAVKVGPKHLLVPARCVTNRPAYAIGKPLRFRAANAVLDTSAADADGGSPEAAAPASDAAASEASAAPDAGAADASESDSGAVAIADAGVDAAAIPATMPGAYEATIAQVQIHPSFLAKCGTGACAADKPGAADVADIAVLILSREIADLPIAPIDLDPVSVGDKMLALGYGCDGNAMTPTAKLLARPTSAVGAEAVLHTGSPYAARPDLARQVGLSYVVTPGPGAPNANGRGAAVCSLRDIGAPLFRSDGSSVVGISTAATILPSQRLPVTSVHARVDSASRHQVGAWLTQLGAKTTKTCSVEDGGCPPQPAPPPIIEAEAGTDGGAPSTTPSELPATPGESGNEAPTEESSNERSPSEDEPAVIKGKKKADDSGCSAAPLGSSSPAPSGLALFAAAALGLVFRSRRRR